MTHDTALISVPTHILPGLAVPPEVSCPDIVNVAPPAKTQYFSLNSGEDSDNDSVLMCEACGRESVDVSNGTAAVQDEVEVHRLRKP